MWTHPHWAGVTRISGNLLANKMLIDITRIRSKSPALNTICREDKSLFTCQTYWHIIYVQMII